VVNCADEEDGDPRMTSKLSPLDLPDVDDAQLPKAPLSLVVAQVRHERLLDAASPTKALAIRDSLGADAGDLSEHRQHVMTLVAGPGASSADTAEGPSGWQLATPDGTSTTVIQQEFFSIETSAYTTWADFRALLATLTTGVATELQPKIEQRIGLRYIDSINHPRVRTAADWSGLIDPNLLGASGAGLLSRSVRAAQQVLEIEGPKGVRVNLRHGSQVAPSGGKPMYLLDLDCYLQAGREFKPNTVLGAFDDLHSVALRLFHACITPALLKEFAGS
jgi:uncharacterized protein (TIGR04255 family)